MVFVFKILQFCWRDKVQIKLISNVMVFERGVLGQIVCVVRSLEGRKGFIEVVEYEGFKLDFYELEDF